MRHGHLSPDIYVGNLTWRATTPVLLFKWREIGGHRDTSAIGPLAREHNPLALPKMSASAADTIVILVHLASKFGHNFWVWPAWLEYQISDKVDIRWINPQCILMKCLWDDKAATVYNTYIIVNFFHDRADDLKVIPRAVISMFWFFLVFFCFLNIFCKLKSIQKTLPTQRLVTASPFSMILQPIAKQ